MNTMAGGIVLLPGLAAGCRWPGRLWKRSLLASFCCPGWRLAAAGRAVCENNGWWQRFAACVPCWLLAGPGSCDNDGW